MKKIFTLSTLGFVTGLSIAAWQYQGPWDERMPPGKNDYNLTLGWLARVTDVAALADVIEDGGEGSPGYKFGYLKVRVVNPIFGCTNGQEIVIAKQNVKAEIVWPPSYDPTFEYHPTNNSRIVFAGLTTWSGKKLNGWTAKEWKMPPQPNIITTNLFVTLYGFTRSWWHDDYQDGLPYTHFTNLSRIVREERNWTNYYHAVRDAVPTPASARVWKDSYGEIFELLLRATQQQFEYMANDPLFPPECVGIKDDILTRTHLVRGFPTDE